jgi:mono/diheme cytochrome c family protein
MIRFLSRYRKLLLVAPLALSVLPGCTREGTFSPVDMWNRSRYKPYEQAAFFDDNNSSRMPVRHTVARGQLRIDDAMYSGFVNGRYSNKFPMPVTKEMLGRGQERYNIYCMPCHGVAGHADGMIVRRGFSPPPDYRIARLRNAPVGHFYEVITNGYGAMYSYAARVAPRDRWAIAAYIRFLQQQQPEVVPDLRYKTSSNPQSRVAPRVEKYPERP